MHKPENELADDSDNVNDNELEENYFELPKSVEALQNRLLGSYQVGGSVQMQRELTASERLSLKHYVAWKKSNGTVLAYGLHAQILQDATGIHIHSHYQVKKLASELTQMKAEKVDICPNSCIAYTGDYEALTSCPFVREGKICGEPRYIQKKTSSKRLHPRVQMMHMPVMAVVRGMFANAETSHLLRYRDKCLQQALKLVATVATNESGSYSDFADSSVHMEHYEKLKLFQDSRDIAFALSTDGAQLTMKKHSDTWIVILILLNLPPEIRYKSKNVIIAFATPGPNAPGNIESFMYPLFQEMAQASEGMWMWDAIDSSHFLNKACICMALGDMLGSAKMNGMAGHSAIYGDRFSMVKGARASTKKGAKAQYYPISPPESKKYNPERPIQYDLDKLPIRDEVSYWKTIEKLEQASSKSARNAITQQTGISRLPLCAASPAFIHPTFFPLDPFHLFYANCGPLFWDMWTIDSLETDIVHLSKDKARRFGELVSIGMSTLPTSFCGIVRDPFLKRQSQYKLYEWMAIIHWYILPIGLELEFNPSVLDNFALFVEILEFSMLIQPRTKSEIYDLHRLIKAFLEGFQKLYIGNDAEKVARFRLCIFQLIHLPRHIEWYGSVRLGSQATMERTIGHVGHKIRSKKAPFANLSNIIFENELIKTLLFHYPSLEWNPPIKTRDFITPHSNIRILAKEYDRDQVFFHHLKAICDWLQRDIDFKLELKRWGKVRLLNGTPLRCQLSEHQGHKHSRSARYFESEEILDGKTRPIFGEALAFYEVIQTTQLLVVYHSLINLTPLLGIWRGTWSKDIKVLPVNQIFDVIGIWSYNSNVYPLRKHAALSLLNPEESEITAEVENDDD